MGDARGALPGSRAGARRCLPRPGARLAARADSAPCGAALPLFAPLPGAALRRHGRGRRPVTERLPEPPMPTTMQEPVEPEAALARRNMIFGLALFSFVVLLFGATILVAYVYLALD